VTQPAGVTAAAGLDILCHALESWTARPFTSYERRAPGARVPYCGANPVSDLWAERAMRLLAQSFRRAVHDGDDPAPGSAGEQAREQMSLAATFAGLGFGNAGVHIPHANAYPIAGRVRDFRPAGYPDAEPIVPHGMAVSLTAPAAFAFTFGADPRRHLEAARLLDPTAEGESADVLPRVLTRLMEDVGMPDGLAAVGYRSGDVPDLVAGSLQQQRLLATAPRAADEDALAAIFEASMTLW
jgi:alcohol dehydrogenase class IV